MDKDWSSTMVSSYCRSACLPASHPTPLNSPMLCVMVRMHNKHFTHCFPRNVSILVVFEYLCKFQQLHCPKWFHGFFFVVPIAFQSIRLHRSLCPSFHYKIFRELMRRKRMRRKKKPIHCLVATHFCHQCFDIHLIYVN